MQKVKNNPGSYVTRSQIRSVSEVSETACEVPKKRTRADFANAVIDNNFYVSFRADGQNGQKK